MEVRVFKTTVTDIKQSKRLKKALAKVFPNARINFDLTDCDNILRIEAEKIDTDLVSNILLHHGHQSELLHW